MRFVGSKLDHSMDTAEIAKRFREDVKSAKKKKEVPSDLKLKVRTRRFAGGSAIDVYIADCGFNPCNPDGRLNEKAQNLEKDLEGLLQAYNYDDSDPMTDYFNVKFYGGIQWDPSLLNSFRES